MAHNTFSRLVNSDNDLEGLVAYSLYKQEKIAWVAQRTTVLSRPPTPQEVEDQFVSMVRDEHIKQWRKNAFQILNQFADNMLAAELEKERARIRDDAIVKAANPHKFKSFLWDTGTNILGSFCFALIGIVFLLASAGENRSRELFASIIKGEPGTEIQATQTRTDQAQTPK